MQIFVPPSPHSEVVAQAISAKQNYFTNATVVLPLSWWLCRIPLLPLFLLRLVLLALTILYMLLAGALLTAGLPHSPELYQPLTGVRGALARLLLRPCLRILLWCLGYWWVEESGQPQLTSPVRGVVSNHVSGLADGAYLLWRTGGGNIVEASSFPPLFARLFRALGVLTFNRAEDGSCTRAKLVATMRNPSSPCMVVFPEGVCSNGSRLLQFKTGAASALQALQPCLLTFPHAAMDPCFTLSGPPLAPHLILRQMLGLHNRMAVAWLPPMAARAEEVRAGGGKGASAFMARVRAAMGAAGGLPLVDWGMADVMLATEALRAGVAAEVGLQVHLQLLREVVDVSRDTRTVKAILQGFSRELRSSGGGSAGGSGSGGEVGGGAAAAATAAGAGSLHTLDFAGFLHLLHALRQQRKGRSLAAPPLSPISLALTQQQWGEEGGGGLSITLSGMQPGATTVLRRLFNLLDADGDGRVGIREVLVGLALLADKESSEGRARGESGGGGGGGGGGHANFLALAFALLDPEDSGQCPRAELEGVIHMVWPQLSAQRLHEISGEAGAEAGSSSAISRAHFLQWAAQPAVLAALRVAFAEISPLAEAAPGQQQSV